MFAVTGWEQYPIVAVVVAVGVFILRWTDKHQRIWLESARTSISRLEEQVVELQADHAMCQWRTEILLGVCRRGGLEVPAEYWSGP